MSSSQCPICFENFPASAIERHASNCKGKKEVVKASDTESPPTRSSPWSGFKRRRSDVGNGGGESGTPKSAKLDQAKEQEGDASASVNRKPPRISNVPLAEMMRPNSLEDYVGQESVVGSGSVWRKLIDRDTIPSMVLWGPPGCGKTSLANIIAQRCKANKVRWVL